MKARYLTAPDAASTDPLTRANQRRRLKKIFDARSLERRIFARNEHYSAIQAHEHARLRRVPYGPLASGSLYGPAPRQRLGQRISVIANNQTFETHPLKGWWVF